MLGPKIWSWKTQAVFFFNFLAQKMGNMMKVWLIFWFRFGSSNLTHVTKRHPGGSCEQLHPKGIIWKKTLEVKETAIENIVLPGIIDCTLCLQTPCVCRFLDPKNIPKPPNLGRYDWKIRCKPLLFQCRLYGKKPIQQIVDTSDFQGGTGSSRSFGMRSSQRLNAGLVYSPPRYSMYNMYNDGLFTYETG